MRKVTSFGQGVGVLISYTVTGWVNKFDSQCFAFLCESEFESPADDSR